MLALWLGAMTFAVDAPATERRVTIPHLGPAPRGAERFRNLDPNFRRASAWVRVRFAALAVSTLLKESPRFEPLPAAAVDAQRLRQNRRDPTVTWIGHSTVLVQLDGLNILTDPNWSARTGPLRGRLGVPRYTPPGVRARTSPVERGRAGGSGA